MRRGLHPGTDFLVLDANPGPGGAWRHRWDSLTLGAAHGIADLPGLAMKRPDPQVPASRLVAEYYGEYERRFRLQVRRPVRVSRVEPYDGNDSRSPLVVISSAGTWAAGLVVNATGTWDAPFVPAVPGASTFSGWQLHTKDFVRADDFRGKRTVVVGGGLSAVQFLLELEQVTQTVWATRRPPNFTRSWQDPRWGLDVERAVRSRTRAGLRPVSVVRTTGIGLIDRYVAGVRRGLLVSRGMFDRVTRQGVVFGRSAPAAADGLGPSASEDLVLPESWQPFPEGTEVRADVIFWNTGFRAALRHLAPMRLHGAQGISMVDEVTPAADGRVLLVGYASSASTVGANRAGRLAGRKAARWRVGDASPNMSV